MKKLLAALLFALIASNPVMAQETTAKNAIVIDYDTGAVLMEKNADERMPTSSMSKVMTMYVVFDALKSGKLKLDDTVAVSEKAWRMQGSKMFIHVGDKVKVEDLVRGVIIQSGNDATIALAEGLSGTEEMFAEALNIKAKELGMNSSNFVNASGWPADDHYSTARDLATLGTRLIRDFPDYYHYYAEKEYTYNKIKQGNRNPLLYRNLGADGIKTGHAEAAGYGLIGSATQKGRRVIMVVNGLSSEKERADESAKLISWGLASFDNVTLYKAGAVVDEALLVMGIKETVPLTIERDILVTIPVNLRNDLKVEVVYTGPVQAPVTKGQKIGVLRINVPRMESFEVPLIAAESVDRLGFFAGNFHKILMMIEGKN